MIRDRPSRALSIATALTRTKPAPVRQSRPTTTVTSISASPS
ncbi:hypothetical protein [Ornithinimicrobium kibberense]